MMETLKPCPICGGDAKYIVNSSGVCVMCLMCGCQTQAHYDSCIDNWRRLSAVETVTQLWNSRIGDAVEQEA